MTHIPHTIPHTIPHKFKLSLTAHFSRDLGLDSLDTVEVLMAIEDEFLIEIPDQEADNMHTVQEAVNYVYERWTPQANW